MPLIGIDFGTSSSKVAAARLGGIDIVTNEFSKRSTPTVMAYTPQNRESGEHASSNITMNYKNTVPHIKRLIGLNYSQVEEEVISGAFPCKVLQGDNDEILIELTYLGKTQVFRPVQILASYFSFLKAHATKDVSVKVRTDAVIAVPCNYTEKQRREVITAARIAGIHVIKLTNDITAASLQFAMYAKLPEPEGDKPAKPMNIAFVDVGYGATSVSVIAMVKGHIKVLSSTCDHRLGGADFDRLLLDYFIAEIKKKYDLDVNSNFRAKLRLARDCEKLKKVLSANTVGQLRIESFMQDKDISFMFERKQFLEMCAPLLERLEAALKSSISESGLPLEELQSVEILGGASYIPAIRDIVSKVYQKQVSQQLNATEAIARGCALEGALRSPSFHLAKKFAISDVVVFPVDIGYCKNSAVANGDTMDTSDDKGEELKFTTVFKHYETSPSKLKKLPLTHVGDLDLVARYSKPELLPPGTETLIGRYKITGIPKDRAAKVNVYFRHTSNGVFSVESAHMVEEVEVEESVPITPEEEEPQQAEAESPKLEKDAMETESDATGTPTETPSETKEEPPKPRFVTKMVKKTIKTDLTVTAFDLPEYPEKQVLAFVAEESKMHAQDTLVRETSDARNDLETYVYYVRDNIDEYGTLGPYVEESNRNQINQTLDSVEEWLYGDGEDAAKEEYVKKLVELKRTTAPIEQRKSEAENRSGLVETLKNTIGQFKSFVDSKDEKYAHIESEDRTKVAEECSKAEEWLQEGLAKIESQSAWTDPAITVADIEQRIMQLKKVCNPIMNKPKPAPPKKEEEDTSKNKEEDTSKKTQDADKPKNEEGKEEEMVDVD